jgi:transketolase
MPALLAVPTRYDRDRYRPLRTRRMADSLRVLALDAAAQPDGRPKGPTGQVEMLVALWDRHLRHHPADPAWADRDRVVSRRPLGSAMHDALLHLTGHDLPMNALRGCAQRGGRRPGRTDPMRDNGADPGPDHGLADAVGMALAEKLLGDEFNRDGHAIVDHRTWIFVDEHCLDEAANRDACALAAGWRLHKLVALHAAGRADEASAWGAGTPARFRRLGWNVIGPVDGHDVDAIDAALHSAVDARDAPSLVVCRIDDEHPTRDLLDWRHPPFDIPRDVYESWNMRARGESACRDWQRRFAAYQRAFPDLAAEFGRRMQGHLPTGFQEALISVMVRFGRASEAAATEDASQEVVAALGPALPELLGGSVAAAGSNLIRFPGFGVLRGTHGERHVDYGVHASGMAAVMNGIALHGGFVPYGESRQVSEGSDALRDAMRTVAQGGQRAVHLFTVSDGDGAPAHAGGVEAAELPQHADLDVWRPCDAAETAVAWIAALARARHSSALLLSRQSMPAQARTPEQVLHIRRGGYVLSDRDGAVAVLLATGTEVPLAIAAQAQLDARGVAVRVVSMPSATVFDRQPASWRDEVLPPGLPQFGIESRHPGSTADALADLVQAGAQRDRDTVRRCCAR